MRLDIYFHTPLEIEGVETGTTAELSALNRKLIRIMALLDDLQAKVERNGEVDQSAVLLLQGLKAKLDEAGVDPAKLKALSDALANSTDALAAAVTANTPAQ